MSAAVRMGGGKNLGEEGDFTWESSDEAPPTISVNVGSDEGGRRSWEGRRCGGPGEKFWEGPGVWGKKITHAHSTHAHTHTHTHTHLRHTHTHTHTFTSVGYG